MVARDASERTHRGLLEHYRLDALQAVVRGCRNAAEDFFTAVVETVAVRGEPPWRVNAPRLVPDTLGPPLAENWPGGCGRRPKGSPPTPSGTT